MTTHILTTMDNGQTEDVMYFDTVICMAKKVWSIAGVRDASRFIAGEKTGENGYSYSWGADADGSKTDYDMWCACCGDFMWHGMNCECENTETDREPLTASQLKML